MSFADVGPLISDTHNSSASAWTTSATLNNALNAGQLGIIIAGTDNTGTGDVASMHHVLTDSVGNTWHKIREFTNTAGGGSASGATLSFWWCVATTTLPTNGTFTLTLRNGVATAKTISGEVFTVSGDFIRLETLTTLLNNAADVGSRTIAGLTSGEYLFVRAIAAERSATTFTPTASYTAMPSVGVGSGATGMNTCGEFRILTATGDTSDPTTTAVDQVSVYCALREVTARTIAYPSRKVLTGSGTGATSFTTAAWLPVAGRTYLIWIYSDATSTVAPTTPTNNGLTWTSQASVASGTTRLTLFSAVGTSPISEGSVFAFGVQSQSRCVWIITEYKHVANVVQAVTAAGATATLAAFAKATNAAVSGFFATATGATFGLGPEAGWQQTDEVFLSGGTGYGVMTAYRPDNGDLTAGTSTATLVIAAELNFVLEALSNALGQPSETDAAQAITHKKARSIGQATEADTAQPVSRTRSRTLAQATETDAAQAITHRKGATLGMAVEIDEALAVTVDMGAATLPPRPRRALLIPALGDTSFDIAAVTKRWFRNGVQPSASAARRLADGINQAIAQRQRPLFAKGNQLALHAAFDSGSNGDLTSWRFACHTGPVTRSLRARVTFLPLPQSAAPAGAPAVQWTKTKGLTGGGTVVVHDPITTPLFSSSADFTASELFSVEQEIVVEPDTSYRFELHQVNNARPVSGSVYEVPRTVLYTDEDYCIDPTAIYQNGPITQQTLEEIFLVGQELWRLGQPLFTWCIDLPGDELTRTTATARNLIDQTISAPTDISPGWPVSVPYSGTLDSAEVPIVMWAYAGAPSGTSTLTWRDQAGNVIGTVTPAGAATWLSTTGVLQDARGATPTTKLDLFLQGDGTNAASVAAAGAFMHAEAA